MIPSIFSEKWMSLRDFAAKYKLNIRTARRWAEEGRLPGKKMGVKGAWYINLPKWNQILEIYAEHEEVCASVVTGYEPGMRRFKVAYSGDKEIIEQENGAISENKIKQEDQ